jgi:hypothetical protein
MKNKTPKSRVMWAIYDSGRDPVVTANKKAAWAYLGKPVRVAVVPLDDMEAIVKRADKAYWADYRQSMAGDLTQIRAALTAAGIPCKRKARK